MHLPEKSASRRGWRSSPTNPVAIEDDPAADVTLGYLHAALSQDLRTSLDAGLAAGVVFEVEGDADALFRAAVRQAITAIESEDQDDLLPRFLSVGPYYVNGEIPRGDADRYMTDDEVAAAIRFIHSSAINSFQGQLAKMLAVGPVVRLADTIISGRTDPPQVFVGDTVLAHPPRRIKQWAKAADFHLLDVHEAPDGAMSSVMVRGVVEVKSYPSTPDKLRTQLERHVARARRGLKILGAKTWPTQVVVGDGAAGPAQIFVVPDTWKLPRRFWFETEGDSSFLHVEPPAPPAGDDRVERLGPREWLVTLRWSQEALAEAAYAMTFWYMGELGRLLYAEHGVPGEWSEMKPEEAGQNAVTMMLYYAILRARTVREESRAIALYNSYGFGYTLGASFVDRRGRREVLFYEDLHEILEHGRSRRTPLNDEHPAQLCRIRSFEPVGSGSRGNGRGV